jgi:uncharacterized protein YacL
MKELKNMLWMMLGVVIGLALAALALIKIFELKPDIADSPTLSLVVAVPLLALGLGGGGWVAQRILERFDKARRRKVQAQKEQDPFRKSRKKKK